MEPISFAASLITLVGLVTASSKKIHELRRKLRNAPKDVESLLEQVQTFEGLLNELNTQLQNHRNNVTPQVTLQQVGGSAIAQMERDVQSLHSVLSKVESQVNKKSKSSKILLLARQMLSEKEVEHYRKKIDTHCTTLTSIQAMVCNRKLETVSQSLDHLGNEDRAGFQTISSQLSQSAGQLGSEIRTGFSTVSSQHAVAESGNHERHLEVLAHLDDHSRRDDLSAEKLDRVFQQQVRSLKLNEAGLQAVHSSLVAASSSNSEAHKATHAMLNRCHSQLQQVLRNRITFGKIGNGLRLSTPSARNPNAITETTVFWKYSSYRMPIGLLKIRLKESRRSKGSAPSTLQVCTESDIAITFVPPRWLSEVAIDYSMKLSYDLTSDQWRWGATLNPLTVNYNPFFINAVENIDVEGVRRSFAEGLARPTDYILRWGRETRPWYNSLSAVRHFDDFTRYGSMFSYMVANGLSGQEEVIRQLAISAGYSALPKDILQKHLRSYVEQGGKLLGADSLLFDFIFTSWQNARIDWIPDFLFSASEPWLVDDMSSIQICYIGAFAHVDAVSCGRLKRGLASCYSPPSSNLTGSEDRLFDTFFGIASIENHFRTLTLYEKHKFLSLLCRTGSVATMKLFIDLGVDLDGGEYYFRNMLGNAAAVGNVDIVKMLLEAGANGSLAIENFLENSEDLSDSLFTSLLELLVGNARPALFELDYEPLLAVITSSRALYFYPMAPQFLLDRDVFTNKCFGDIATRPWYGYSYMYQAISRGHSSVVDLLLRNGACADAQISQLFDCKGMWFESCTWLTFAVRCGQASCADVLIRHGADVTALDGAGKSAVQMARQNAMASHPRYSREPSRFNITAEQDAETLVVVERAFSSIFQGTMSIEEFLKSSETLPQPPPPRKKSTPMLQKMVEKTLFFLTPSQKYLLLNYLKSLHRNTKKIWSLPFHEALLMRFIYVLSYAILFAYELHAFLKGRKRIPMPSRFFLSSLALLALGIIWGSSPQGGFGWGLFGDAGEEHKTESGN